MRTPHVGTTSVKRAASVLVIVAAVLAASLGVSGAVASSEGTLPHAQLETATEQPGALVTDEELCAFRAPLALTGSGEVPAICDGIVSWLRRLETQAPACFALWIETGAIPECARPYR